MFNQFLLILKNSDEGKFNGFKRKSFNKQTEKILRKNNSNHVLGLHKGVISNKVWNKIKNNDKIYITIDNETFRISANLTKKSKNLKYGETVYPDLVDKKEINYFLFFEKLNSCREPFEVLKKRSKLRKFSREGIFEMKEEPNPEKIKKTKINKPLIEKTLSKVERKHREFQALVRSQANVNQLKKLYSNQCQIQQCAFKLNYEKDGKIKQYSHVHHYNPLSESLSDSLNNMIVLCPNHHAEFDFKVKLIDYDGKTIINQKGKETGETLKFHKGHQLDIRNIRSLLGE